MLEHGPHKKIEGKKNAHTGVHRQQRTTCSRPTRGSKQWSRQRRRDRKPFAGDTRKLEVSAIFFFKEKKSQRSIHRSGPYGTFIMRAGDMYNSNDDDNEKAEPCSARASGRVCGRAGPSRQGRRVWPRRGRASARRSTTPSPRPVDPTRPTRPARPVDPAHQTRPAPPSYPAHPAHRDCPLPLGIGLSPATRQGQGQV